MKTKIFKKALFTLVCVMAANVMFAQQRTDSITGLVVATAPTPLRAQAYPGVFAAPATMVIFSPQDSTYRKEYKKLQDQMNELRTKMSKLRTEELRKSSEKLRESSEKMQELNRANSNKSFQTLRSYSYSENVSGESKGLGVTSNSRSFSYSDGKGADYWKNKIANGEVKEKTKSYTKSYAIDRDDKIMIENLFGKVVINTWAKNEVKVDVEIKADAHDDASAQNLLNAVSITDSKSESTVSFKTAITKDDDNRGDNTRTEVNYTVYMPAKSPLVLTNKFGAVKMPDLSGKISLNLSFGSLSAQQLTNPLNELTVKFGDATIESLNSAGMNISYGKLNIGTADNLKAKLSFSSGNVDKLRSSGDITVKYGAGLKVGQLLNVKNLNVDASFTKVLLNVKDDYDFDVNTKMGSFNYDNNGSVKVLTTSPESTSGYSSSKTYKGKVGRGSTDKNITIKSSYSSVKFDEL